MKLITRQDIINSIPSRLRRTYGRDRRPMVGDLSPQEIANRLDEMDDPTREDALRLMSGWPDWTTNECDECGEDCEALVQMGEEPDYDARWQELCASCLKSALNLLQEESE